MLVSPIHRYAYAVESNANQRRCEWPVSLGGSSIRNLGCVPRRDATPRRSLGYAHPTLRNESLSRVAVIRPCARDRAPKRRCMCVCVCVVCVCVCARCRVCIVCVSDVCPPLCCRNPLLPSLASLVVVDNASCVSHFRRLLRPLFQIFERANNRPPEQFSCSHLASSR